MDTNPLWQVRAGNGGLEQEERKDGTTRRLQVKTLYQRVLLILRLIR